jgi:PAS domain-containing protein
VKRLLAQAEATDAEEDARYGADQRGDELPAELARRETRLQKIQQAKRALEERVREQTKNQGKAEEKEHRLLMSDGSVKHLRVVGHRSGQGESDHVEFVGAVTDVSEQKRAEEALRQSENYLAEAQRLSQTGSWAWNASTREIRYWSEECYRLLGFDPRGPLPRFETFFQRIYPDDQIAFSEQFQKAIREKPDFAVDYRLNHPRTGIRDIHVVGHAVLAHPATLLNTWEP